MEGIEFEWLCKRDINWYIRVSSGFVLADHMAVKLIMCIYFTKISDFTPIYPQFWT